LGSGHRFNSNSRLLTCLLVAFRLAAQEDVLERAASLDAEHKCEEAERTYQSLLNGGSPSSALLNNLGYHYLTCGSRQQAEIAFERILKIDPSHRNANLELARLAVERNNGASALTHVGRIRSGDAEVGLVRAEALDITGKHQAAAKILNGLLQSAGGDPRLLFAVGMTYGRIHKYADAEKVFSEVLQQVPDDFDVLYNLGLAAARGSDYERAERAFEAALKTHPEDVDTLYELGRVKQARHDYLPAVYLLSQARHLAPQRADVTLALARAAQSGGYYGDAILAYDEYLKLRPGDDMVRRDRALVFGFSQGGLQQGLRDLRAHVEKHPNDAVGYYDLAQLSDRQERAEALRNVSKAVQSAPDFEKAHYYRAWLLEQLGRFAESAAEARRAIQLDAHDVRALDLLGLDCLNLGRAVDAEQPLRTAIALEPNDQDVLFHLSRVLIETGRASDAQPLLNRFKQAQSRPNPSPREEAGVIDAASLSSSERTDRIVIQLRQYAAEYPTEPGVKLNLGKALLAAGQYGGAAAVFGELLAMKPDVDVLESAGAALLRFGQYALARQFLEPAAAASESAKVDLAAAVFFTDGPAQALNILDTMANTEPSGDRLLLRAQILDAMGRREEADRALAETPQHSISRPQLAVEAIRLLLRHGQTAKALELTGTALQSAPDDPDLLLIKAIALRAANRQADSLESVKQLQQRWPEWDQPYLLEAYLLGDKARIGEARQKAQIAVALGAEKAAADCAVQRIASACSCDLFFPCKQDSQH
jgi:tetratricopeptide (TPR) repeat protein